MHNIPLSELPKVLLVAAEIQEATAILQFYNFAKSVLDTSKGYIGNQARLMPALAEATVEDRQRQGFSPNETLLRTGNLRDSYSMRFEALPGGMAQAEIGSDSLKALWSEFGTSGGGWGGKGGPQPPRPVLGQAVMERTTEGFSAIYSSLPTAFESATAGGAKTIVRGATLAVPTEYGSIGIRRIKNPLGR